MHDFSSKFDSVYSKYYFLRKNINVFLKNNVRNFPLPNRSHLRCNAVIIITKQRHKDSSSKRHIVINILKKLIFII